MTKTISATFVAIIGISLLTMTVTEASSPAKPNTAYSLEVLPADHTIKKDPVTGATLTFLTTKTPSSGIYFHERSWLANSSMIVFQGHRGLMGYLTATGELVVLATPSGGLGAATAAAQRNSVFCMRGGDVLELALTIEASPTPAGTPSKVTVVERRIATLPSGGQLNVSHDDRYSFSHSQEGGSQHHQRYQRCGRTCEGSVPGGVAKPMAWSSAMESHRVESAQLRWG
jgi:hypothetical protein